MLSDSDLINKAEKTSRGISSGQIRKSCDVCSKAKKKCNGEMPCASCIRWKVQCSYSMKLKPGPNSSTKAVNHDSNSQTKKQRVSVTYESRRKTNDETEQISAEELLLTSQEYPPNLLNPLNRGSAGPGQKELFHIQLHIRLTSCNFPICSTKFLSIGYRHLFNSTKSLTSEKNIFVALAWCAAALGASSIHDPSALEYCRCARESLRFVMFDNYSDFLARAFFALELACHITIIQKALVEDSDPSCPASFGIYTTFYSPGQFLGLGRAVLAQVPRYLIQGETLILLWHAHALNEVFNSTYFRRRELAPLAPLSPMDKFPLSLMVEQPKPGDEKIAQFANALNLCYYSNMVSLDWIRRLSQPDYFTSWTREDHIQLLAMDLGYMRGFEGQLDIEAHPIPYILLQFSIHLHKLKLNQDGGVEAFGGLVNLASFICKRPLVIFSPQIWHCVHLLLRLLYQYRHDDSRPQCEYLGRVLVRTMHRLKRTDDPWARYTQITLNMSLTQFTAIANSGENNLKQLIYSRCPLLFAMYTSHLDSEKATTSNSQTGLVNPPVPTHISEYLVPLSLCNKLSSTSPSEGLGIDVENAAVHSKLAPLDFSKRSLENESSPLVNRQLQQSSSIQQQPALVRNPPLVGTGGQESYYPLPMSTHLGPPKKRAYSETSSSSSTSCNEDNNIMGTIQCSSNDTSVTVEKNNTSHHNVPKFPSNDFVAVCSDASLSSPSLNDSLQTSSRSYRSSSPQMTGRNDEEAVVSPEVGETSVTPSPEVLGMMQVNNKPIDFGSNNHSSSPPSGLLNILSNKDHNQGVLKGLETFDDSNAPSRFDEFCGSCNIPANNNTTINIKDENNNDSSGGTGKNKPKTDEEGPLSVLGQLANIAVNHSAVLDSLTNHQLSHQQQQQQQHSYQHPLLFQPYHAVPNPVLLPPTLPPVVLLPKLTLPQLARILRLHEKFYYWEGDAALSAARLTHSAEHALSLLPSSDVVVVYHSEESNMLPSPSASQPYIVGGEPTVILHLFRPISLL